MSWVTSVTNATSGAPSDQSSRYDGSGWVISTGGSKATGGARSGGEGSSAGLGAGLSDQTLILAVVAAIALLLIVRKRKGS
jgi:hypothetical protein